MEEKGFGFGEGCEEVEKGLGLLEGWIGDFDLNIVSPRFMAGCDGF